MPGQKRLSMADLLKEVGEAKRYGVNAFMLFPKVDDGLKTNMGEFSCWTFLYAPEILSVVFAVVRLARPHLLFSRLSAKEVRAVRHADANSSDGRVTGTVAKREIASRFSSEWTECCL